jgi:mannose-6-phosphate isomerase-like protein (cupin superfamily)
MHFEKRPWGEFLVLEERPGFKVKRLHVKPGGRLSLQSHRHRGEHWTVAQGIATVTVGEQLLHLTPTRSVYIPAGVTHRLENLHPEPLEVIEVQFGDYLGEDDITRYADIYNRV